MTLDDQLKRAGDIAIKIHTGQYDKNGQPYLGHVMRVMNAGHSMEEKIVGVLHDVVEDSVLTLSDLEAEGFSREILQAIDVLTHKDSVSYEEYINLIAKNPLAVRVKLNDLADNMNLCRLKVLDEKALNRIQKYHKAYRRLISVNFNR